MEILSGEQMRHVDRRAIDDLGIPSLELMEAAGRGVAEALLRDFPALASTKVRVICGKGNNGGDGFVVARHLRRAGVLVEAVVLAAPAALSPDSRVNYAAATAAGVPVHEVADESAWEASKRGVLDADLVVDAILGTGVRGGARDLAGRVIEDLVDAGTAIASIDLPSGLDADVGAVEGPALTARRTYTLCRPKLALVFEPAASRAGAWTVIDIGIPDAAVEAERAEVEWLDAGALAGLLPARASGSHKGNFGHLLAVAGSAGKSGAAVLLARASLRSGVGLMTVATGTASYPLVAVQQAEVMVEPLAETANGGLGEAALATCRDLLEGKSALAVGPGLGADPDTRRFVIDLLVANDVPVVVDADGLNALAAATGARRDARPGIAAVLTPHPGEAARLLGSNTADVQADRPAAARRLARERGAVVVLKGHRTIVADAEGRLSINSTGNPGMATAGSGDVLTGVIGALLARGLTARNAARLAVFVHGAAGDLAVREYGEDGMIAGDLIARLPAALAGLAGRSGD